MTFAVDWTIGPGELLIGPFDLEHSSTPPGTMDVGARREKQIHEELGPGGGCAVKGGISSKSAQTVLGAWTIDGKARRFLTLLCSIDTRARRILQRIPL